MTANLNLKNAGLFMDWSSGKPIIIMTHGQQSQIVAEKFPEEVQEIIESNKRKDSLPAPTLKKKWYQWLVDIWTRWFARQLDKRA